MTHQDINYKEYINVATKYLQRITGVGDITARLYHCDTHLTIEDIVSSSMEKLLLASPESITPAYVKITAKSVYFDEVKLRSKLDYVDKTRKVESSEDDGIPPIEETLVEDIYDHISDLKEQAMITLNDECKDILVLTLEGHTQQDIAAAMNMSKRDVVKCVNIIRDTINDL